MRLPPEHLETLAAVVDTGTFDAAAVELRITPSAVSQRIKALEGAVGRVLLQRTKPVRPTDSGEVLIRMARQLTLLQDDALAALGTEQHGSVRPTLAIVINADSLNTWVLPVLATVAAAHEVCFDVRREDEQHSIGLLRDGSVMAAITSVAEPVQGCTVRTLGRMRYQPFAAPGFLDHWFPDGVSADRLAVAPMVTFDRLDRLQDRYLDLRGPSTGSGGVAGSGGPPTGSGGGAPPRHSVPASAEFVEAIRLGLGWGMLPAAQSRALVGSGELVALDPDRFVDVPLYWQRWKLRSPLLEALSEAIVAAAPQHLS